VFSYYFILASVPCFLLFLASLRGRLASSEGGSAPLSGFVFATGICYAAALLIGDSARGVVAHSVKFGDEPLPGPDTLRYLTSLSTVMVGLVAIPAAAITAGAASWLIVRTRALPVWLGVAGAVVVIGTAVAVALDAGPFASPLIQLWVMPQASSSGAQGTLKPRRGSPTQGCTGIRNCRARRPNRRPGDVAGATVSATSPRRAEAVTARFPAASTAPSAVEAAVPPIRGSAWR
jgi:hypothetical protein